MAKLKASEMQPITLIDEDDVEHTFKLADVLEVDGNTYAVLLPNEATDDEDDETVVLRLDKDEDGEPFFNAIDSDYELEAVLNAYELENADEETVAS